MDSLATSKDGQKTHEVNNRQKRGGREQKLGEWSCQTTKNDELGSEGELLQLPGKHMINRRSGIWKSEGGDFVSGDNNWVWDSQWCLKSGETLDFVFKCGVSRSFGSQYARRCVEFFLLEIAK